jgi:hypothetical protein
MPFSTETKVATVTSENYIDVKYEYFGLPNDDGLRLRTRDVWFATKPTVPEFHIVDKDDNPVPEYEANVDTAWTIGKAGQTDFIICDVDDINGLRALLDALERDFERRAMEELLRADSEENEDEVDSEDDSE